MTEQKIAAPLPATAPASRLARWLAHPALISLVLAAATLAVFYPVVHHQFVSYDDGDYVTDNPDVKAGLSGAGAAWAFQAGHAGNWHPLTWLSHMLDAQLYGLNPAGHHLANLLFHAANAVLLFLVLKRGTSECGVRSAECGMQNETQGGQLRIPHSALRTSWLCAMVAALFALHPLRVESVAWVSERKDVLSGFFFMLTLLAYVRYVQSAECGVRSAECGSAQHATRNTGDASRTRYPGSRFYLLALVCFALGLMSKPMLVTVPFVLLLLDYWPLGRMQKEEGRMQKEEAESATRNPQPAILHRSSTPPLRLVLEKLPFFALAAASCVVTVLAQQQAMQPLANLSLGARAGNAAVACARYLGKTFWPVNLATPYPHPGHWPAVAVVLAAALVAGLTLGAVWLGRKSRYAFTGWFWFLGMLVPVIGLVQVGEQSMADRYTYLPLIGVFIIVVWGVAELACRCAPRAAALPAGCGPAARPRGLRWTAPCGVFIVSLAVLVLAACAARTRDQLRHWRDSESLYRHAVAVSRGNFIAYYNLGSWLDSQGRADEALTNYFKAVEIQPRYPDPLNNIGCILAARKQFAEAVPYFEAALRSRPDYGRAHENLAAALRELGRTQEAIPHLRAVLENKPQDTGALNGLGNALAGQGQYAEAVRYYEASVRAKPDQHAAHYGLANALARLGRADDAVAHYRLALQAKPDFAQAHNDLGIVLARQGRLHEAILALREAARVEPGTATFQLNLGRMLAARQELGEAITCYQAALRIAPDNAEAHNGMGAALAATGKLDEGIVHLREAARLRPDNANAHFNLGKALAAQGKPEEAAGHFREALRLRPDFAPARQELEAITGQKP
ncbi:MAG TPA: tetratricopeptide repeat protein [Verrucomicrobiota bacterium]|nr:tetratricopeptide repeat protein [Verrucomicrobiota bacterium]HQL78373.1 tetratricopeptide repeat protein [Verrucomicrobiota bacterium]